MKKLKKIVLVSLAVVIGGVALLAFLGSLLPEPSEPAPSAPSVSVPVTPPPASEPTPSVEPTPDVEPSSEPAPAENPLMAAAFQTADILNGFGTEKIGEYGFVEIAKADMEAVTSDQLLEFCESRYDGSGLNWVWIMFEDGTGIHVGPGWTVQMEYGITDAADRSFSAAGAITRLQADGYVAANFAYVPYDESTD